MDSSTSYSSAYEGDEESSAPVWVVVLINVLLTFLTVFGNFLVILAYIRDEKIKRTVAYTIILNLSVTDILVGIFNFPINTVWWFTDHWVYGKIPCKLWLVLDYSVLSMSTFTIVYISLDRYWLLNMGLDYQRFQTMRKVLVVLGLSWLITVIVYLSIAFVYPVLDRDHPFEKNNCELEAVQSTWFNFFELIVQFIIPFSALVFLNINVYHNVRMRARGLVSIKYELSDPSNTNTRDGSGAREISAGENVDREISAREISTTNMETKQPSETMELQEREEAKDETDVISTHSLSIVSLEGENGTVVTTDGESSRPTSALEPIKIVTYAPLSEAQPPLEVARSVRLGPKPKHAAPVERKRRKSHYRREKTEFRKYRKAAITLAALVTVFGICWLPYYICAIISSFCSDCIHWKTLEVVTYLQWCNSTINPFIYGFTNLLFRRNFVKFLHVESCIKKKHLVAGSSAY